MDWEMIIFGHYTLRQLATYAGAALVALIVIKCLVGLFFKKHKEDKTMQICRCKNCGWQGQVSRYAGRCPQCNEPIGDWKARPY